MKSNEIEQRILCETPPYSKGEEMSHITDTAGEIRTFDTGATRDSESGKLDFEGFLSPLTLRRYAKYMHAHRKQSDGNMRDSDNWQKGIPLIAYLKSLWRHLVDLWTLHRNPEFGHQIDTEDALCAIIFNASGYLHELLKDKNKVSSNAP